MLIHRASRQIFFVHIYIHIFFTFTIGTIFFFALDMNKDKKDLNEKVKDVIDDSNVFDNISTNNKAADTNILNSIESIYKNNSYYDKEFNSMLETVAISKLFIFFGSLIFILMISNNNFSFHKELFFDKISYFILIGCLYYLFYYAVEKNYTGTFREEIQEELIDGLKGN